MRTCVRSTIFSALVFSLAPSAAFADSDVHLEAKEISSNQIGVTIKDSSGQASPIQVHVYFIGRAPNRGARFIYAHSDLLVNMRGSPEAGTKINVPELKSDPKKRAPVGTAYVGVGDKEGWIVIGKSNGKTFQVLGSSPDLRDIAQRKSRQSLDSMIADYEKRMAATRKK